MAPMYLCERCLEDAVERTATDTRWGAPLCEKCAREYDEADYESKLSPQDIAQFGGEPSL